MATRKIEIKNGALTRKIEVEEGTTVGQIKEKLGSKFSLTGDHQAYIKNAGGNATAASDDTVLEDGASLDFMRNTGQKG